MIQDSVIGVVSTLNCTKCSINAQAKSGFVMPDTLCPLGEVKLSLCLTFRRSDNIMVHFLGFMSLSIDISSFRARDTRREKIGQRWTLPIRKLALFLLNRMHLPPVYRV